MSGGSPAATDPLTLDAPVTPASRRRWAVLVRMAVSLALLGWVLTRADLRQVSRTFAVGESGWLLVVMALFPLAPLLTAARWQLLLQAQGHRLPLPYLLESCLAAIFARQFLPSTVGGDALRACDSWRAGVPRGRALLTIVLDRALGLVVVFLFAAYGVIVLGSRMPGGGRVAVALGAVTVLGAAVLLALWRLAPRRERGSSWPAAGLAPVGRLLASAAAAANELRGQPAVILRAVLLSFLLQVEVVTLYWLLGRALVLDLSWLRFAAVTPLAVVVMMLPVSINGIGLREGVLVLLLGLVGIDRSRALAFAWAEYAMYLVWGVIGGVVLALRSASGATGDRLTGPAR